MPQELLIDNPDGAVFSLSDWEEAVWKLDRVRLETALDDPEDTFEDAELFDEESGQWYPTFRWGQNGIAFNARIVNFFADEDPNWKIATSLAAELGAKIRDEEGNVCYPDDFEPEPAKAEAAELPADNLTYYPPKYQTRLELWYGYQSLNGPLLAEELASWLKQQNVTKNTYLNARKVSLKRIPLAVDSAAYPTFQIATSRFGCGYNNNRSYGFDYFYISCLEHAPLAFWESILDRFRGFGSFVSARLVDLEYEKWQNEKDISSYKQSNRAHEHLPKVKNDLSPPFDYLIVDISANPGRIVRSKGVLEAIGGVMWLSDAFFDATGSNKNDVRQADFLEWDERGDCLVVTIDHDLLQNGDTDTELVEKQKRLRKLLFPNGSDAV